LGQSLAKLINMSFDGSWNASPSTKCRSAAAGAFRQGLSLSYRNLMGPLDTLKAPKKDSMEMDYIPVHDGERTGASTIKILLGSGFTVHGA